MSDLEKLREELEAAKVFKDLELKAAYSWRNESMAPIIERHDKRVKDAWAALRNAEERYQAALAEGATHPYEGRTVRAKFASEDTARRGIVELRRADTRFASNTQEYNKPKMGELFVRLLKKDGTKGIRFENYWPYWELIEEKERKCP